MDIISIFHIIALIILIIAILFREWKTLPAMEAVFKGIRPAVVGLIAAPLVSMANKEARGSSHVFLLISLVAALLIWLVGVNPVWVILGTIILTPLTLFIRQQRK